MWKALTGEGREPHTLRQTTTLKYWNQLTEKKSRKQ